MDEIERLSPDSGDPDAERKRQLAELFPEAFEDGKIDMDALRDALGDIVDDGDERYAFTWPGKRDAIRQSQIPSTATLRPQKDKSVNWDDTKNIYIEGDNLEVLKLLQHSYHGKVKMIYIDPPYNTGKDFVYKDTFGDSVANYKEQAGLAGQSNPDTSGRYHSNWCSMMYPRLKLARELLTDDGVFFASIGDQELQSLLFMCNEVFGEDKHIGTFVWKSRAKPSNTGEAKVKPQNDAEYIVCYARDNNPKFKLVLSGNARSYPHHDEDGNYRLQTILKSNRGESMRSTMRFSIGGYTPPIDKRWQAGEETVKELYANNRITFETGEPMLKYYEHEENAEYSPFYCFIDKEKSGTAESGKKELNELVGNQHGFDTVKPTYLIRYFIQHVVDENDTVMDFFAGSSTTAESVFRENLSTGLRRNWILVQFPESYKKLAQVNQGFKTVCDMGEKRIRQVGKIITEEVERSNQKLKLDEEPKKVPDIGFRVFSLDESGIRRPEATQSGTLFDAGTLFDNVVKPDRSDEDIIFEMMLKWGLGLSLPIEKVDAAGYPCYSVACGELVCCMADGLTMEALDAIAEMEPRRVLMLDSILTDTLKLNAIQVFRRVGERTGVEVELRTV